MNRSDFLNKFEKVSVEQTTYHGDDAPVVSVCIQTYQQVNYIEECLDSILEQDINFSYEILIGEDDSNDGTRAICEEYANRYPDKIRLFLHSRKNNIKIAGHPTGKFNFFYNLFHAKGKYIAICEGDDFWDDVNKLQDQYNFMESHPECSMCFTAAKTKKNKQPFKSTVKRPPGAKPNRIYSVRDAIIKAGEFAPTASMFFRQKFLQEVPDWVFYAPVGDMPLTLYLGTKGNFGYLDKASVVRRSMADNSWSATMNYQRRREIVKELLSTKESFNEYTNYQYNTLVKLEKARIHFNDKKSIVKRAIAQTPLGRKLKEWFDL